MHNWAVVVTHISGIDDVGVIFYEVELSRLFNIFIYYLQH